MYLNRASLCVGEQRTKRIFQLVVTFPEIERRDLTVNSFSLESRPSFMLQYTYLNHPKGGSPMATTRAERLRIAGLADAINQIEGAPISDYAKKLTSLWVDGELTNQQRHEALLAYHQAKARREAAARE
jgi:hypothetical protein